jgi:cobalt-zinc-cadmium efflux system outer membrane protein
MGNAFAPPALGETHSIDTSRACGLVVTPFHPNHPILMPRFHALVFFFSLALASRAERFTLDSAVIHAINNNPDLAAARLSVDEAKARLTHAGRLPNPDLESELRPNLAGREFSVGVGFVQKFPLTDRLRLEKQISQSGVLQAETEVAAAERTLATAIRALGVRMLALQDEKVLKESMVNNSKELASSAAKIAAMGEGSSLEAAQFELEAQQLSIDVLNLEAEKAAILGQLRPLLGVPSEAPLVLDGALPPAVLPRISVPDFKQLPDYQLALARVEAARHTLALAKASKWEDISVGLAAEIDRSEDAPEGLQTDGFLGLKLSVPLPLWNKNEGRIAEAAASAVRSEKEVLALAARVRAEAAAAHAEMQAAQRVATQTKEMLIPKAILLEERLTDAYRTAQPGSQLSDVLRAREKRLALEKAKLDALRTFHLARVRYEAAMGR